MSFSEQAEIALSRTWGEARWTDPLGFRFAVRNLLREWLDMALVPDLKG